jgi:hypothetical protein
MDYSLEAALHAQRSAAEALAEHFVDKNDCKAMELFDELLDAQKMLLVILNDQWRDSLKKRKLSYASTK